MDPEDDELHRRTIWVSNCLWDSVRDKAQERGVSNSHVIRRLLTHWVKKKQ